jgi:hypothetical protein
LVREISNNNFIDLSRLVRICLRRRLQSPNFLTFNEPRIRFLAPEKFKKKKRRPSLFADVGVGSIPLPLLTKQPRKKKEKD